MCLLGSEYDANDDGMKTMASSFFANKQYVCSLSCVFSEIVSGLLLLSVYFCMFPFHAS